MHLALRRNVTPERIHEVLCEHGGELKLKDVMKQLGVNRRDNFGYGILRKLIEIMSDYGIVTIDDLESSNPTVALTKVWGVMCLEEESLKEIENLVKEVENVQDLHGRVSKVAKELTELKSVVEELKEQIGSSESPPVDEEMLAKLDFRVSKLEERMEVLNKKTDLLKQAIEKVIAILKGGT